MRMGRARGVTGGPDPPEKSQNYRVFSGNTGPDPLKNDKVTNRPGVIVISNCNYL